MCSTCISFVKRQLIWLKSSFCFRLFSVLEFLLNCLTKKSFNQWYEFLSMIPSKWIRLCHLIFRLEFWQNDTYILHTMYSICIALQKFCEKMFDKIFERTSKYVDDLTYYITEQENFGTIFPDTKSFFSVGLAHASKIFGPLM